MAIEISNLEVILKRVQDKVKKYKPVLLEAVKVEQGRVKERTQRGQGLNSSFLGYSESWAKARQRHTPPRQTAFVDLTFTGAMFSSLNTTQADVSEAVTVTTVGFNGDFNNLKASVNNKSRPFFGFSKEQVQIILSKLKLTK